MRIVRLRTRNANSRVAFASIIAVALVCIVGRSQLRTRLVVCCEFCRNKPLVDQFSGGVEENLKIGPERTVPNIEHLQLELCRPEQLLISTFWIRAPGQNGALIRVPDACPVRDTWPSR